TLVAASRCSGPGSVPPAEGIAAAARSVMVGADDRVVERRASLLATLAVASAWRPSEEERSAACASGERWHRSHVRDRCSLDGVLLVPTAPCRWRVPLLAVPSTLDRS